MAKPKKKKGDKSESSRIAVNKRARHDYLIDDTLEAGIELMGWEVKSPVSYTHLTLPTICSV